MRIAFYALTGLCVLLSVLTACDFTKHNKAEQFIDLEENEIRRVPWNPTQQQFKGQKPPFYFVMTTLTESASPDSAYNVRAYILDVPKEAMNLEKRSVDVVFPLEIAPPNAELGRDGKPIYRTVKAVIPDHPSAMSWLQEQMQMVQIGEWLPQENSMQSKSNGTETQGVGYHMQCSYTRICTGKTVVKDGKEYYFETNCVELTPTCKLLSFYIEDAEPDMGSAGSSSNPCYLYNISSFFAELLGCGMGGGGGVELANDGGGDYKPCPGDVVGVTRLAAPAGPSGIEGARFRDCVGDNCPPDRKAVRRDKDGNPKPHRGVDLACTPGQYIYAPYTITITGYGNLVNTSGSGLGNWVRGNVVVEGETINMGFAHLDFIPPFLTGQTIEQGSPIGVCGRSGITDRDNPSHVHIEAAKSGGQVFYSGHRDKNVNAESYLATKYNNQGLPINPNPCIL